MEALWRLLWRDFYYNIIDKYDVIGKSLYPKYDKIKWIGTERQFSAWKKGRTGVPIVDAGMRELNTTGYMHNRCRMIVSNYLVKVLGIDWRKGERYFATKLTDYDVAQNNGGWQWSAGGGADSQQYSRIFNPYTQSKKFDRDCVYIKKWVLELKNVPPSDIHSWDKSYSKYRGCLKPIVDYATNKKIMLDNFKKL